MDATPSYATVLDVPKAIHAVYPAALRPSLRFLVILREPVSRLFSMYHHVRCRILVHWPISAKKCAPLVRSGSSAGEPGSPFRRWPSPDPPTHSASNCDTFEADLRVRVRLGNTTRVVPSEQARACGINVRGHLIRNWTFAQFADAAVGECTGLSGENLFEVLRSFVSGFGPSQLLAVTTDLLWDLATLPSVLRAIVDFMGFRALTPGEKPVDDSDVPPAWFERPLANTNSEGSACQMAKLPPPGKLEESLDCAQAFRLHGVLQHTMDSVFKLVGGPHRPTMQPRLPPFQPVTARLNCSSPLDERDAFERLPALRPVRFEDLATRRRRRRR